MKTPEQIQAKNDRNRERRKTDPEYRERIKQYQAKYLASHTETREQDIIKQNEKKKQRYRDDPEYKRKALEYAKNYAAKNKDRIKANKRTPESKARAKELRLRNVDRKRDIEVQCKFGITATDYRALIESQNDTCAICGKKENVVATRWGHSVPKRLSVDHCHSTGKVRGLLCSSCNRGLGYFKDDADLMEKAIQYLLR